MTIKKMASRLHWILDTQFGIDLRKTFWGLLGMPRYVRDVIRFRSNYAGRMDFLPCLHDWSHEAGVTKSEYFWQDLLVARMIFKAKPERHVDVGSRVDGFVAHVASFREIEVFDVRPLTHLIPGVTFKSADLMQPLDDFKEYCDSLSCLHALEHFGLGRYGDPICPNGFERGLANMAGLLKHNGTFYLSVPIGIDRVEFNAHRVFDPRDIIELAERKSLKLSELVVIRPGGGIETIPLNAEQLENMANERYSLGLFSFVKSI